jgi:hypothetical protein
MGWHERQVFTYDPRQVTAEELAKEKAARLREEAEADLDRSTSMAYDDA